MEVSTKIICVFRSKTDLFAFIDTMKSYGALVFTVGTPKEAKIGCGISARFDERYLFLAKKILKSGEYPSFYGVYKVKRVGIRTTTELIYP